MQKEKIIELTEKGKDVREISKELGVTAETLEMFCKIQNIKLNPRKPTTHQLKERSFRQLLNKGQEDDNAHEEVSSDQIAEKARNLYFEEGLTQLEIVERLRISQSAVSKYVVAGREAGQIRVTNVNRQRREKAESKKFNPPKEEILEMYRGKKMTRREIANHYKVSMKLVDAYMTLNDITLGAHEITFRNGRIKSIAEFESAVEKYGNAHDVAAHFGMSEGGVYYYMNRLGLVFNKQEDERMDQLALIYENSGTSLTEFVKQFDLSYSTFYTFLNRKGIAIKKVNHSIPLGVVDMCLAGICDEWHDLKDYEGKYKVNRDGLVVYYSPKRIRLAGMKRVGDDYEIYLTPKTVLLRSDILKQFKGVVV